VSLSNWAYLGSPNCIQCSIKRSTTNRAVTGGPGQAAGKPPSSGIPGQKDAVTAIERASPLDDSPSAL
jgi:hypothetical protein